MRPDAQQPWSSAARWGPPPPAPQPGIIPLRPLGVGDVFEGAITALRRHPKALFLPSLLVAVALSAASFLVALATLPLYGTLEGFDPETSDPVTVLRGTASLAAAGLVSLLLQVVGVMLLSGVVTAVIGRAVLGRPVSATDAWRAVRPMSWRLAAIGLLVLLGVVLGLPFCLVPGIVVGVYFSLAGAALVLEKGTVFGSMKRSWSLVTDTFWRTFGALLLVGVVSGLIYGVLTVPTSLPELIAPSVDTTTFSVDTTQFVINQAIAAVGAGIAWTISMPFSASVIALLYLDRRMRKENLHVTLAQVAGGDAV